MKKALFILAAFLAFSPARAVEILRWQRLPLAVPLAVGEERVVFVERNMRVGVPASLAQTLRVQSTGGAIYLRADSPFPPTRLQLQDAESGALILVDVTAQAALAGQPPLEPVRIVEEDALQRTQPVSATEGHSMPAARADTPLPVALIRFAAQSLYAPLRTVEPVPGIVRVQIPSDLPVDTVLPMFPLRAQALAAWRLEDEWVTAVLLTNRSAARIDLDPRLLQGDFAAASFQHPYLGPAGQPADTSVVYLVTRHHGLAGSLWPRIAPFDAGASRKKGESDAR